MFVFTNFTSINFLDNFLFDPLLILDQYSNQIIPTINRYIILLCFILRDICKIANAVTMILLMLGLGLLANPRLPSYPPTELTGIYTGPL